MCTHREPAGPHPSDLDWSDLQGNILRAYRHHRATTYLFLAVQDAAAARDWLRELADQVTTADGPEPEVAVNVGVSCAGLLRLGYPPERVARLPEAFREGMAARAGRLGDPVAPDGTPLGWHPPFDVPGGVHLVLMVSGSQEGVPTRVTELTQGLWQTGLIECPGPDGGAAPAASRIEGHRLDGNVEHFGYRDGLSQPAVEGVAEDLVGPGTGRLVEGRWQPLRAGQFVLGQPADDGSVDDVEPALTRNGSYLVLRKLEQDVAAYRRMVDDAARATGADPDLVRAKVMGRWPDGTPLTRRPGGPDAGLAEDPMGRNDFHYDDDPDGVRCPVGAHVRRANPRGSMGFGGRLEHRRRIIRRGVPYGPPYRPGAADAAAERGLLFACYQADIAGQFELVQAQWLADGNAFGLGTDRDPVAADPAGGSGLMRFEEHVEPDAAPGRAPGLVDTREPCVRLRGGEYLLVPGRAALRRLGELPEVPRPRRGPGPAQGERR